MKELKQSIIDDLVAKINASPYLIIADYGGLTVAEFEDLRKKLAEGEAEVHVTKNSFIKRAAAQVPRSSDDGRRHKLVPQSLLLCFTRERWPAS